MSRKALLVALFLSLVFNVFVLVGFARARAMHGPMRDWKIDSQREPGRPRQPNGPMPTKHFGKDLKLDERQQQLFAQLQEDYRQRGTVFEHSSALLRQSMNEELRKENPDIERVRELVNEESDLFRQRRLSEANLFGRFLRELSPEQRRIMVERFGRSGQHQPPPIPQRILEKFDLNRNGRLEPDEMREARREMERRRREMPDQPGGQPPLPQSGSPSNGLPPDGPRHSDVPQRDQPPPPSGPGQRRLETS